MYRRVRNWCVHRDGACAQAPFAFVELDMEAFARKNKHCGPYLMLAHILLSLTYQIRKYVCSSTQVGL
jgi:hypothetical protein